MPKVDYWRAEDVRLIPNRLIPEDLWKQLMQETLDSVIRLLDASNKLLLNGGNEAICAGLYTYAVEEYGKLLLLKQYVPSNGKVTIDYEKIFRDKRHKNKYRAAIENLKKQAPECMILMKGSFDPVFFDPQIFDTTAPIIADFKTRMEIFYCDIADSGDGIKQVPPVDKSLLKNAIDKLKIIALAMTIP
jgi:AbiV family abortive infection protein